MPQSTETSTPGWLKSRLGKADVLFFLAFMTAILIRSITELDLNWDSINYHLPFAARRAGLIPASSYEFTGFLEDCYKGFPALPYYLSGFLWWVSRDMNTPNIISGLAFAGYCLFVARMFRAPLMIAAVSIAAIPAIQVNLSSVMVDLVTNVCFAGGLVLATSVLIERDRPLLWRVVGALAFVSVSANWKLQFVALAGIFVPAFACVLFAAKENGRSLLSMLTDEIRRASLPVKGLFLAVVLLCYAAALKNMIFYHNPLFPMGVTVMGYRLLPGITAADLHHEPAYLDGAPEFIKWVLSVLEYLSLGFRPVPYTLGQGSVPGESQSLRMGGYCAMFVVYNLGIFVWGTLFSTHPRRALFGGFLALTAVVACLPNAHELRYYSFWMLYLVSLNIALLWKWQPDAGGRRHFALVAFGTFVFVASVTGWRVFVPGHVTARTRITDLNLYRIFEPGLEDGQKYCLVNWSPYPILAASFFHHGHQYAIREANGLDCPPDLVRLDLEKLRAGG